MSHPKGAVHNSAGEANAEASKQKKENCKYAACVTAPPPDDPPLMVLMGALGHHGLPRALFRFLRTTNPNAYRWLNYKFVTGRLAGEHYYDAAHRAYNEAVRDVLKLDTEEGQAEIASDGVRGAVRAAQKILSSDDPAIKGFLDNMKTPDGMTGREALERALTGDGEAAGEFLSGALAEIVEGAAIE